MSEYKENNGGIFSVAMASPVKTAERAVLDPVFNPNIRADLSINKTGDLANLKNKQMAPLAPTNSNNDNVVDEKEVDDELNKEDEKENKPEQNSSTSSGLKFGSRLPQPSKSHHNGETADSITQGNKGISSKPPQHNGVRIKKRHLPVTSSGYGKIRRSSSASSLQRLSGNKSNESDDDDSSVCSTQSRKRYHSAPNSPLCFRKSLTHSNNRKSITRTKAVIGTSSLWAQKQRQYQKQRQRRRMVQSNEENFSGGSDSEFSSKNNSLLKRTTCSNSLKLGLTTPNGRTHKSKKTSEASTPGSVSTQCSYDGTHPVKGDTSDKKIERPKTPISPIKYTTNKILATWRSPRKNEDKQKSSSKREKLNTPSSAKSWAKVAASPGRSFFDSSASEVRTLAEGIFAPGTGLSDEDIRKILNTKVAGGKQWELKKKLESSAKYIKRLKETLNSLLLAKNRLIAGAIEAEKTARSAWARELHKARQLEDDVNSIKKQIKQLEVDNVILTDNAKDAKREISQRKEKIASLETEVASLKESLAAAEREQTQASIALAIAEGRLEESTKQADGWRAEIAAVEASKADALKQAESKVSAAMEREMADLRDECAALRTKMESREEELGRLVNSDSRNSSGGSQLDDVKRELDRLRERVSEAESHLALRDAELARAVADSDAAAARAAAKDRDMSELMKGLSDIQRSGQAREEEAKELKKAAEEKAAELELLLSESRGEISVLIHEKATLKESLDDSKRQLIAAEKALQELKKESLDLKAESNAHATNLKVEKELRARAEVKEEEERHERIACSAQMVAMTKEHAKVEAQLKEANDSLERQWRETLDNEKGQREQKEKELSDAKETIAGFEGERKSLMKALNDKKSIADAKSVEEIGRLNGEINILKEKLRESDRRATSFGQASTEQIRTLDEQLRESQAERRRMHNIIQELRGNVRVFARVRPFLPADDVDSDAEPCVVSKNESSLKIVKGEGAGPEYDFSFDRVFSPSIGQDAIFEEVSEFVQSALDGYNVCLFSYGQTGSGKTHTMQGSGVGQMRGIIPRAIEQVGRYKETLEREGWRYEMKVSFLEIYNESIRDLLRDEGSPEVKHDIKVDSDGRRYVNDLTMKDLEPTDVEAVEDVMRQAAKHRSVASTDMNAVSSRSHSVFTLHLTAMHSKQRTALRGTLNLVDLAGSERLERSGATGDRAKEAMAINKSLSSLTDVFVAIGKKASHIPFRNSKLTYLLQPSLSGNGKTLMMVNLSPTEASVQESLCTLRFASQVNKCELGKPRRAIEEVSCDDDSTASSKNDGSVMSSKSTGFSNKYSVPKGFNVRSMKRKLVK